MKNKLMQEHACALQNKATEKSLVLSEAKNLLENFLGTKSIFSTKSHLNHIKYGNALFYMISNMMPSAR